MTAEIRHRTIALNRIEMHVAEAGDGPLVLMCHGWPELWYSWRHQLRALAEAGFRTRLRPTCADSARRATAPAGRCRGLHDPAQCRRRRRTRHGNLGAARALIVGHDWGAPVAWHAALLRPDLYPAVACSRRAASRRGAAPPLAVLRKAGKGDFYYLYFQEQAAKTSSRAMSASRSAACSTSARARRRAIAR